MIMVELIINGGPLSWMALGITLLLIEVLFTGTGHFVWIGSAALIAALLSWFGLASVVQWISFAIFSLVGGIGWKYYQRKFPTKNDPADALNHRANSLVGREAQVAEAIVDGRGRVKLGDTTWLVEGPDLKVGSKVRIVAFKGALLQVAAV